MNVKDKLEKLYNMDFAKVIMEVHIKNRKSISQISKECKVSRKAIAQLCKKFGLTQMNQRDAAIAKYKNGYINPLTGVENPLQRKRMTENNPIKNKDAANKRAVSMQKALSKISLPQEVVFGEILNEYKIKYEYQKPIGPYNIDFFIAENCLCIEIDSDHKWGKYKKMKAKERDTFLNDQGLNVLRINKLLLQNKSIIIDILNANNVIC